MRGQTGVSLLVQPGKMPAYIQPGNNGGFSGLNNLPTRPEETSYPLPVRQHDSGGLH